MTFRSSAVLLATLAASSAWGQDLNVYGTTLFQLTKQATPGFRTETYTPATQFLGVDATDLGHAGLSLHVFGWGRADLADQSRVEGKNFGELSYGYVQYRAPEGNLELKAGRFSVNQGVAIEQVDGGSFQADLLNGFTLSAFGGVPVSYRTIDRTSQKEYDYQRDNIVGGRLGKRFSRWGEVGVSYVQEGSTSARYLYSDIVIPNDFTRRQAAADILFTPGSAVTLNGRTVVDVAPRLDTPAGVPQDTSRIAEHDYSLDVKVSSLFSLTGSYTQRNFQAYYAGTNLPTLFNPYELGRFRATGLAATFGSPSSWEAVLDVKRTNRDTYGQSTRFGGEVRHHLGDIGVQYGLGAHRVVADNVPISGVLTTLYGLSYNEGRLWLMYGKDRLSVSFDGIMQEFDNCNNLAGRTSLHELVGSVGYQVTPAFKVSGDLSHGTTPTLDQQTVAMVRLDYRFGTGGK
jgi:hypothetical protein